MVVLQYLLLLSILISTNGVSGHCGSGWKEYKQSCYKFVTGRPVTHPQAERLCKKIGGHLASINTQAEKSFVQKISQLGRKRSCIWVGLVKLEDGKWYWTDRSKGNGVEWAPGQPNNGGGNEKCAGLVSTHGRLDRMHDLGCSLKTTRFVCEKKSKNSRTKVRRTLFEGCRSRFARPAVKIPRRKGVSSGCTRGWKLFGQSCYKVASGRRVTHPQAEKLCRRMGGHLASINTPAENSFLQKISKLGGKHNFVDQPWVGLVKLEDGNWHWTDRSSAKGFEWASGQPDNYKGREKCGMFIADVQSRQGKVFYNGQTGVMNDVRCGYKSKRFICEKKSLKTKQKKERRTKIQTAPAKKPQNEIVAPVVGTSPIKGDSSGCSRGWKLFGQSCYKVASGSRVTHPQAEKICMRMGGHLASINTPAENSFLQKISKLGGKHNFVDQPWVGLVKLEDGNWHWTDRSSARGFKWASGQPDNYKGREKCGMFIADVQSRRGKVFYNGQTGVMNDVRCGYKSKRFICEKKSLKTKQKKERRINIQTAPATKPQNEIVAPVVGTSPIKAPVADIVDCPPDTVTTSQGCKCKPGYVDIVDTNLPEKNKYKRGKMCIPDDPCHSVNGKLTVIFVVDSSGSISGTDWKHVLNFVRLAAPLVPKSSRVGFVKFARKVSASTWLKNGWTEKDFIAGVPTKHDYGRTNTAAAFNTAENMLNGDTNARKVVILITDGIPNIYGKSRDESDQLTKQAAQKLSSKGTTVLAVGIGEHIKTGSVFLKGWLEDAEKDYFAYHQGISMLGGTHMKNVMKRVCDASSSIKHSG